MENKVQTRPDFEGYMQETTHEIKIPERLISRNILVHQQECMYYSIQIQMKDTYYYNCDLSRFPLKFFTNEPETNCFPF